MAGIYRVTRQGVNASGSPYPPLRNIILSKYHHDLSIVDVSLVLSQQSEGYFQTERELRLAHWGNKIGGTGHLSDGQFVTKERSIAIEVELHKKGQRRRDGIMKHYLKNFEINEVWYLCGTAAIQKLMEEYRLNMPYLKVMLLESFLSQEVDHVRITR